MFIIFISLLLSQLFLLQTRNSIEGMTDEANFVNLKSQLFPSIEVEDKDGKKKYDNPEIKIPT